nr:hypothetical protein [Tanacetum cinerariifolium]
MRVYDDFKDIEYVEASLYDLEIVSEEENDVEEENVVHQKEKEFDNFLLDNFSPEFETFCDHSEETRSGNTTHPNYSLPKYDSFCFEIEPDQERLINLMKNDIPDNSSNDPLLEEADLFLSDDSIPPEISDKLNEDKCFDPGREINVSIKIEDDNYFLFMFVIRFFLPYFIFLEISPLFLSAESEDTIFDPVYDKSFKDIEYVDASVPDPTIVRIEEENVVHQEDEESLKDNSTPDRVFNSFEFDNSLLDNFSPEFKTFCDHSKETRSGNTTHANYSLLEYDSFRVEIEPNQERLINLVENNSSDSSNDPLLE